MALLNHDRMTEAARHIARGKPTVALIDRFETELRDEGTDEVAKHDKKTLRRILSDEISRANPKSNRWAQSKYQDIYDLERTKLQAEFVEQASMARDELLASLNADIAELEEMAAQFKQAAIPVDEDGNADLLPATSLGETTQLAKGYQDLKGKIYSLKVFKYQLLEQLTRSPELPMLGSTGPPALKG